jgi:putative DNA-invertase from lambdoid prophage Rac
VVRKKAATSNHEPARMEGEAIAEFERSIIQERVAAGLRAAKAKGVQLGRRSTLHRHQQQVIALLAEGFGIRALARRLNLPLGSAHKLVKATKAFRG